LNIFFGLIAGIGLLVGGLVVILWLRKRFTNAELQLVGELARVETSLTPSGSVIAGGELWLAHSANGEVIPAQSFVRIVGVQDISLIVEAC
jgi:membrane-bound ClpP family serine protease